MHKKYLSYVGENYPKTGNVKSLPPKVFGSHNSLLAEMFSDGKVQLPDPERNQRAKELAEKHKTVRLTEAERIRLTTWIDSNALFYGTYWGRRNIRHKDHPNYRPTYTFEQSINMEPPVPEEQR